MSQKFQVVYLARHASTAWSDSGQHTGLTDLPLTPGGEENARKLGKRLRGMVFAKVWSSPLQRASRTCELAGFGEVAAKDPDLVEWDYGEYEGLTTGEILAKNPNWQLFRDGCPGGESPAQINARVDRVLERVRAVEGDVLLFSSAHTSRVFAGRWLALGNDGGKYLVLDTVSLSALTYEHDHSEPVVRFWNDTSHLRD